MASQYPPKKNDTSGYTFYVGLVSQADTMLLQANPTLAEDDVKIAIDEGDPANLATLPVVDANFTKRIIVVLSQAEINGDNVTLIFSDAVGAEWCDLEINIQTVPDRLTKENIATQISTQFGILKNAGFTFTFEMQLLNGNPATGKTVTEEVSKDGGAYAAAAGTASEISSGTYKMVATAADMNATIVTFRFTATGCKETKIQIKTGT